MLVWKKPNQKHGFCNGRQDQAQGVRVMGSLVGGSLVKSKRGRGTDGRKKRTDGRTDEKLGGKFGGRKTEGGKRTDGQRGRWWVVFCVKAKVLRTYGSL